MPKHEKPLHWDMSFDEALQRVAQTDPRELPKPTAKVQKKKPKRQPSPIYGYRPTRIVNDKLLGRSSKRIVQTALSLHVYCHLGRVLSDDN